MVKNLNFLNGLHLYIVTKYNYLGDIICAKGDAIDSIMVRI